VVEVDAEADPPSATNGHVESPARSDPGTWSPAISPALTSAKTGSPPSYANPRPAGNAAPASRTRIMHAHASAASGRRASVRSASERGEDGAGEDLRDARPRREVHGVAVEEDRVSGADAR
jgi:hypothetical protein